MKSSLPWLFFVAAAGCAAPTSERLGTNASSITAGEPDPGDATVWIVGRLGGQTGYCSGVVVSPHVVLTAAHCALEKAKFSVFLGDDYNDATAKAKPENSVAVVSQRRHPDYDVVTNLHDLAVLVTGAAIPRTPAAINRAPLTEKDRGATIRVAGFGQTSATDKTIGRRHAATTTIDSIDATGLAMKGTPSFCFFDSGGPTYMTRGGHEVVVGIHSIMESKECDGIAWDGRVDTHATFVDGVIAEVDPPPLPSPEPTNPAPERAPPTNDTARDEGGCRASPAGPSSRASSVLLVAAALLLGRRRSRILGR